LADVIVEPVATLVLARSPFGYSQDPDAVAAPANVLVTGADWLELELAEEQPAASRAAAATTSRPEPARRCRYRLEVI
jgi:hypothetical protein